MIDEPKLPPEILAEVTRLANHANTLEGFAKGLDAEPPPLAMQRRIRTLELLVAGLLRDNCKLSLERAEMLVRACQQPQPKPLVLG